MKSFISEDDIEQAILAKLDAQPFNYDIVRCAIEKQEDLNDGTGRSSKKQCVLPKVVMQSLQNINPHVSKEELMPVYEKLVTVYNKADMVETNYKLYQMLRNTVKISVKRNGRNVTEFVNIIDFNNPENNTFTAVSQMWIQGQVYWRRPDILIFVNGLPLVFIELKKSTRKVREAYNDNLTNYKRDIPNLFAFNQICVLSNGMETRLGAFNASYSFFFEWLKVKSEKEEINREEIKNTNSSFRYFVDGLLDKTNLIDYIENFILFENKKVKIIAKNHQFLGVNNLITSVKNREALKGKLGVFWHTQGSGKSYSMVMFSRKVSRKIPGNFTFLVITDRDDLDTQIQKNFIRTEVVDEKDDCRPKNSGMLRDFLTNSETHKYIFTLIHKFRYDKTKDFPILSTRNDIIVMVDEAHRTQYKDLAENMRRALPNAQYIAFTGTPLLGAKRLTNQWFGDYVSEYNFAQSVEDGSTRPLFYSRRVPEVALQNDFLNDDVIEIIEEENLNEAEQAIVENGTSRILEVIKRDDRLDKVAADIAHHFPRRGWLGKGMVVSVDKYTAVRMYDKVQHYWAIEKQKLLQERNYAATKERRAEISKILKYMDSVEMAVVISEEDNEKEKFEKQGLHISSHREKINYITPDGKDIEDRFKDPNDNLQLVFVCAMWLTGFDVPSISTLYLDKPMKGHTLMQAIARANRVYEDKPCGIVVDYVNVFKYMKQALADYATGDDEDNMPAKNIDDLVAHVDACVDETDSYLKSIGLDITNVMDESSVFDKLDAYREMYDVLVAKDETKEKFKVMSNTLINLYEAAKPEIIEMHWHNEKFTPLLYLHGLYHNEVNDEKIAVAKQRIGSLLDTSVVSNVVKENDDNDYVIHERKVIDLSKIDVDSLRKEIKTAKYKAIEIEDLRAFIEEALLRMVKENATRISFSERFKGIIDRYNAGGSENEDYYEQLIQLVQDLQQEGNRAAQEGLTEQELEIYDLLAAGRKLTKDEEQKVKLAAKHLFKKLQEEKDRLLVVDWYKDVNTKMLVRDAIMKSLDDDLPESYDKDIFNSKTNILLTHFMDMSIQGYGWIGTVA